MRRDEGGQVAVLAIGLAIVCFAIAGLAIDGTRAMIARRSLQNLADTVVTSAASEIDTHRYYGSGGRRLVIQGPQAQNAASKLLSERGLQARASLSIRDEEVHLVLRTEVRTTFLRSVGIEAIPVAASASAEPFAQQIPIDR